MLTQWHHSGRCGANPVGFALWPQRRVVSGSSSTDYVIALRLNQVYLDPGSSCTDNSGISPCSSLSGHANADESWTTTTRTIWASSLAGAALTNIWHGFVLHIKWSAIGQGFIELFYSPSSTLRLVQQPLTCPDGTTSHRCSGINTLYAYPTSRADFDHGGHYFYADPGLNADNCFQDDSGAFAWGSVQHNYPKQGLYRNPSITLDGTCYHAGLQQGASFSTVATFSRCQCASNWSARPRFFRMLVTMTRSRAPADVAESFSPRWMHAQSDENHPLPPLRRVLGDRLRPRRPTTDRVWRRG